jgi:hypothetical protein
MKKLISLFSIIILLALLITSNQVEAAREPGGFHGSGGPGGFQGSRGPGDSHSHRSRGPGDSHRSRVPGEFHGSRVHGGFHGHIGSWPGLIFGGALAWSLWPYYYPPYYYYPPPPDYYYPPAPDYDYPPPDQSSQMPPSASEGTGAKLFIYPRQGQSEQQKAKDVEKCHGWAVGQTGFDPSKPPVSAPSPQTIQKSGDYFRAISACLDAQGYTVR